jgi:hypothetical protein
MARIVLLTLVAALATAATSVWAAGDGPATLTACLTENGELHDVAVGSAPARDCKAKETQVQLAGPRQTTNYTAFRRRLFHVTALSPATQVVLTLHVPAGKYVVATHVLAFNSASGFAHLRCTTSPSIGAPASGLVLGDLNVGNVNGFVGAGTIAGTSPMTVAEGATLQMSCTSLPGATTGDPTVSWGVITATPIDDFVVEEDTSTG